MKKLLVGLFALCIFVPNVDARPSVKKWTAEQKQQIITVCADQTDERIPEQARTQLCVCYVRKISIVHSFAWLMDGNPVTPKERQEITRSTQACTAEVLKNFPNDTSTVL